MNYLFWEYWFLDYPTTSNAYDTSFNNGDFFGFINYPVNTNSYYLEYPNGTDIVVTKFSSDGSIY